MELEWGGVDYSRGVERNWMGWNWNGFWWSGAEWSGKEWIRIEWNWSGLESSKMKCSEPQRNGNR